MVFHFFFFHPLGEEKSFSFILSKPVFTQLLGSIDDLSFTDSGLYKKEKNNFVHFAHMRFDAVALLYIFK